MKHTYYILTTNPLREDLKGLFKLASLAINMYLFSIIEFIQTPFSRQLQLLTKQNRLSSPTRWSPVSENLLILTCLYSGRTMEYQHANSIVRITFCVFENLFSLPLKVWIVCILSRRRTNGIYDAVSPTHYWQMHWYAWWNRPNIDSAELKTECGHHNWSPNIHKWKRTHKKFPCQTLVLEFEEGEKTFFSLNGKYLYIISLFL